MATSKTDVPVGVLVFDLDGTIVDTAEDIVASSNHVRAQCGLTPLERQHVLELVGHGAPFLVAGLTGVAEDAGPEFDALLDAFRRHYAEHQSERSQLYPGAENALDSLARRFHLYVLSNKPHSAVIHELQVQGIAALFRAVWGAGALAVLKPDPAGVIEAMRRSAVGAERTIMIGDSGIDVRTGVNAGVTTVFAAWGFNPLGPDDPRPHAVVKSFAELEGIISRLIAAD